MHFSPSIVSVPIHGLLSGSREWPATTSLCQPPAKRSKQTSRGAPSQEAKQPPLYDNDDEGDDDDDYSDDGDDGYDDDDYYYDYYDDEWDLSAGIESQGPHL
jgi:hypothetical protein